MVFVLLFMVREIGLSLRVSHSESVSDSGAFWGREFGFVWVLSLD